MAVQIFTTDVAELENLLTKILSKLLLDNKLQNNPDNTPLTPQMAADLLCISKPTLLKYRTKYALPHIKTDRGVLYYKQELLDAFKGIAGRNKRG